MNWVYITDVLSKTEPFLWLTVLGSAFVGEKKAHAATSPKTQSGRYDEVPPSYGALKIFVILKFLGSLVYPAFIGGLLPGHLSQRALHTLYLTAYWAVYLLSSICVFFVMAALIRRSLQPLPGLSTAALTVFKWAAFLAFILAITAHLPVFGPRTLDLLLNEVSISFLLCICAFELSLLTLLLRQMRRLGMCLRSRPIGLALGLALLSFMDLSDAATANTPQHLQDVVAAYNEMANIFVPLFWTFYILRPEPKRLPHALSPASRLMKWNEIALKLGVSGKQAETVPFISGVESTVDAILDRFKERAG